MDILIYICAGVAAGTMAGLLGIGGGVIIVPVLYALLGKKPEIDPSILMHLALGTSLAIMMVTSFGSALNHHRKKAVDWSVVRQFIAGLLFGTLAGAWLAKLIPSDGLTLFFAVFLALVALQIFFSKAKSEGDHQASQLETLAASSGIGVLSSLLGIGGGTLTVPYLLWRQVAMVKAVATSSACGWFIAVFGCLGYIWAGWGDARLPAGATGFVYWPVFLVIALSSYFSTGIGVALSHRLPVRLLKKIFAVFLAIVSLKMAFF